MPCLSIISLCLSTDEKFLVKRKVPAGARIFKIQRTRTICIFYLVSSYFVGISSIGCGDGRVAGADYETVGEEKEEQTIIVLSIVRVFVTFFPRWQQNILHSNRELLRYLNP